MTTISEVQVRSASGGYRVSVGSGARRALAKAVARAAPSGRCGVIADERVAGFWWDDARSRLEAAGIDPTPAFFPPGEKSKTRATWANLTDSLLRARLGRDACVVALGGGVTGDLAGFVAATYLRGVPLVQAPTTTLAMIDASVGGKTGVDHPSGKNLVGAFHAPAAVLADPDLLTTLDSGVRAQGYAEALKHGAVADASYARSLAARARPLIAGDADAVRSAVVRSVEIKAEVVSGDEFESGSRQILNFGHTVGHALELASGYELPHGHAVAAGMVAEARLGERLGVTAPGTAAELAELVRAFGLPSQHPALSRPRELVELMAGDKKTRRGVVSLALIARLGQAWRGGGGPAGSGGCTFPLATRELAAALAPPGNGSVARGGRVARMGVGADGD